MISFLFIDTTKTLVWRLAAQLIDVVLVFLTSIILVALFRPLGLIFWWTVVWVFLLYSTLMDTYRQGTIGKLYLGLRVVKKHARSSKLLTSFYRNVTKLFIAIFLFEIYLLLIRKGYSGFHNRIAGTTIVGDIK